MGDCVLVVGTFVGRGEVVGSLYVGENVGHEVDSLSSICRTL